MAIESPPPSRSLDPRRPFTTLQADAAGITRKALQSKRFQRMGHGVYIASGQPITLPVRVGAAMLYAPPGTHASHRTAAELWGLWVDPDDEIHVCCAPGKRVRRHGVRDHQCQRHRPARAEDFALAQGVLASTPVVCFLELADVLGLVDLVLVGDSIVRRRRATVDGLIGAAGAFVGDGAFRAREAAALVRAGVDSRMETRTRILLVAGGLPEPTVDHRLYNDGGYLRRRIDLAYPDLKLAIEYDGRHHIDRKDQWHSDLGRREELEAEGWRFIVLTKEDVFREPLRTLMRVRDALCERGVVVGALHDDWKRYFREE